MLKLILLAIGLSTGLAVALLSTSQVDSRAGAAPDEGWVAGHLYRAEDGTPLPYGNIIAVGTTYGAMSDSAGVFVIRLPAGEYRIRAMMMRFKNVEYDGVTVVANDTTRVELHMMPSGLTAAQAAAESIGVDVAIEPGEVWCEIVPMKEQFVVGDHAAFRVRIHNASDQAFLLVRALDGSDRGRRFPTIAWQVTGPPGGVAEERVLYCGNLNPLTPSDFVTMTAGATIDPYPDCGDEGGSGALRLYSFSKPGRYTVTFRYSTDEGDIRRWLGDPDGRGVRPEISQGIRRVPRLTISASATVEVAEVAAE